jgi:type IX secretion system PorP/SprF family membrane protein
MKQHIILLFFMLVSLNFVSQMESHSNQWSSNIQHFNSAVVGLYPSFEAKSQYRMQWVGFDGAPRTTRISVIAPLVKKMKLYELTRHGIGVSMETDRIAAFSVNKFQFQYGIHLRLKHKHRLSFGLSAGAFQMGYNPEKVETFYPDANSKIQSSFVKPYVNIGTISSGERYAAGLSVNHFIPTKWDKIGLNSNYSTELILFGKYAFQIHEDYNVIPSLLIKNTFNAPFMIEVNSKLNYLNRIFTLVGWRLNRSIYAGMEFRLSKKWNLAYTFEYGIAKFDNFLFSSHEFGLCFRLPNKVIEPGYEHKTAF